MMLPVVSTPVQTPVQKQPQTNAQRRYSRWYRKQKEKQAKELAALQAAKLAALQAAKVEKEKQAKEFAGHEVVTWMNELAQEESHGPDGGMSSGSGDDGDMDAMIALSLQLDKEREEREGCVTPIPRNEHTRASTPTPEIAVLHMLCQICDRADCANPDSMLCWAVPP